MLVGGKKKDLRRWRDEERPPISPTTQMHSTKLRCQSRQCQQIPKVSAARYHHAHQFRGSRLLGVHWIYKTSNTVIGAGAPHLDSYFVDSIHAKGGGRSQQQHRKHLLVAFTSSIPLLTQRGSSKYLHQTHQAIQYALVRSIAAVRSAPHRCQSST